MRIAGREINDECTQCKNMLECELFKQGHGIHCERENVVAMMRCQMNHEWSGRCEKGCVVFEQVH